MNDRTSFLDAIHREPADDTVRLVYADWLDENGAGDLDTATATFIRLSCARTGKRRMPDEAYSWLLTWTWAADQKVPPVPVENWRRLVPRLVACHRPYYADDKIDATRSGRFVTARGAFVCGAGVRRMLPLRRVKLSFARGFLEDFALSLPSYRDAIAPVLLRDQPLCCSLGRLMVGGAA